MRMRTILPFLAAAALGSPAAASASFPHVVAPGESLTSVAAADGLTVDQLAAANGISPGAQLVSGSTLMIPPQQGGVGGSPTGGGSQVTATAPSAGTSSAGDGDGDSDDVGAAATSGSGGGAYVVQPGDTLSAIAARAGISVGQLAAANGLDPNGVLLSGSTLQLSGSSSGTAVRVSTSSSSSASSGATIGGSYVVQPGDTLSAIAARAGTTVAQLAVDNGLDPNAPLLSGSALTLPGGGSSSATASAESQPVGVAAEGSPTSPPFPTPERVSASEVGSIASANGVPPSLAEAIGWQESGFNNDLVSTADARGVMQILPGTWDWIQRTLTPAAPLAPASAASNVRGGVLLLHSLLGSTGGDPAATAAGYFQGLSSVQQNGEFPDTQQYVNSVMALEHQFGGG
jgi:N-acetylmuramoyl-L-alanine amidase